MHCQLKTSTLVGVEGLGQQSTPLPYPCLCDGYVTLENVVKLSSLMLVIIIILFQGQILWSESLLPCSFLLNNTE